MALTNIYYSFINTTTSTSSMIIDPMFLAHETCSVDSSNTIFVRQFGIPCKINDKNSLYKEFPTMKCFVYTLYHPAMIIPPSVHKMIS